MENGVFEIINEEGAICRVDTVDEGSQYYGPVWRAICESKLQGKTLLAVFDGIQYRSNNGDPDLSSPTGFRVKIMEEVDAFLPGNHFIKRRAFDEDYVGAVLVVKVREFDPHSRQVIVTESSNAMAIIEEAYREDKLLKGEIKRFQYKTNGVEESSIYLTGFIVGIEDVDLFLPVTNFGKWRDTSRDFSGQQVAVMVDQFYENPMNIILKEIPTTDISNIDIDLLNETLELIGKAYEERKYVAGTIVGEKLNQQQNRAGYAVSINGLETFLPCNLAPPDLATDISPALGRHIVARVEAIDTDRMGIVLSAVDSFSDPTQKTTELSNQPLIVFTDASVVPDKDIATFAIVVQNICQDFEIPQELIDKYNLRAEPESSNDISVFTGIILNFGIDAAEFIALLATVELLRYICVATGQKIVIYTDSLFSKKLFESDQLEGEQLIYKDLHQRLMSIVTQENLDISVKKVEAHSGINNNELADRVAKNRLRSRFA
jgi:ribonuclease HI